MLKSSSNAPNLRSVFLDPGIAMDSLTVMTRVMSLQLVERSLARMASLNATIQSVCLRHTFVMEMMTVVITLMKIQGMPVDLLHSGMTSNLSILSSSY